MNQHARFAAFSSLIACCACGSAESNRDALGFEAGDPGPARPAASPSEFLDSDAPAVARDDVAACPVERVTLRETRRPIDIIMVLDNSVSMASELDAVERNINQHFSRILDASGADYRVILISRHRTDARTRTDDARTAICVSEPLSSLEACPASQPGPTSRFFQYGISIDSNDSLSRLLETYARPDPLYHLTTLGWSEWLRADSRKIFLEFSDDDALSSAPDFVAALSSLAPEQFGTPSQPTFAFHSIIGIAERNSGAAYLPGEPLVKERCSVADGIAPSSGPTYQELSRLTGGLRYPLCHLDGYDAIFESIARDSIERSGLGCSFPVPEPRGDTRLDLARIQLVQSGAGAEREILSQVDAVQACAPGAFFVHEARIELCPETCEALLDAPTASVSAEFDCNAYIDVR
jgi:hypothetical protein